MCAPCDDRCVLRPPPAYGASTPPPLTALVCDDHEATLLALARALYVCGGAESVLARTAEEALRLAETAGPFDVVVAEASLGTSLFRDLRAIEADAGRPPRALVAASLDEGLEGPSLAAGADVFLWKRAGGVLRGVLAAAARADRAKPDRAAAPLPGRRGLAVFAGRRRLPVGFALPYYGVVRPEGSGAGLYSVSADYAGDPVPGTWVRTMRGAVVDGDPNPGGAMEGRPRSATIASRVNEPSSGRRPNCCLMQNPWVTRRELAAALASGGERALLAAFVVVATPVEPGEELLAHYGEYYERRGYRPSPPRPAEARAAIDVAWRRCRDEGLGRTAPELEGDGAALARRGRRRSAPAHKI
ncbi:hypothetical protein JKP88DRAFT_322765 [Tribonema minus]|uniref:Response regulatory domain-containing protein n=1 Tax=Tribonema minus TaxID=303371 RepID=A0A835YVW7_9STRA|nr:hypothetical protein JKP88DRAFT_322765 [Tribonema minus]